MKTKTMIIRKIPFELHKKFKLACVKEGISQNDKVIELMKKSTG